jgi:hypothetical protein
MARRVDPHTFMLVGCVIDWAEIGKTQQQPIPIDELLKERGVDSGRTLQLRWFFDPALGYPRTPFTVWARQRKSAAGVTVSATPMLLGGIPLLVLDQAYVEVILDVSGGPGGLILAMSGMPYVSPVVDIKPVAAGATAVRLSGPEIRTLVVPAGTTLNGVVGQLGDVADDKAWQEVEIVGLPGDGRSAIGTDLLAKQGLISALTDPVSAALDRYRRGAPFYGWDALLEASVTAPSWVLADPKAIIELFQKEMLPDFVTMVDTATAANQETLNFSRTVATPTGQTAQATFNPLRLLLYGASTDPLNSLVTGFGTAYDAAVVGRGASSTTLSHIGPSQAALMDLMVTATFVDPLGKDVEWAALLLGGVSTSLPPSTPAAVIAANQGLQSPDVLDGPYKPVVTISWDAAPTILPFHLGSQALARRGITPSSGAAALMSPRPGDVALQPIGATTSTVTPSRRSTSDSTAEIDGVAGTNTERYSVAAQDIFGRWSHWGSASCDVSEPPAGKVTLAGALLDTAVATGPCPATLTVEITWDWTNRSPQTIDVAGRLFGQVWAQDPPADTSVPTIPGAFGTALSGSMALITFNVDGSVAAITPGSGLTATVQHLSPDAMSIVTAPVTARAPRRYRLTVSGFNLDFGVSGRWGLALWARGREHVAPGRVGPWTSTPVIASAADPRPPVIQTSYELVQMTSMRDAEGLYHANLVWTAIPGAVGYRIYTAAESTFRALTNMPVVTADTTLTQRLAALRSTFQATPARRPFTRTSPQPVTGTSAQVTLPRGTKDLHMFVVLGVSAGEVESDWPVGTDPSCGKRFVAFAAPQTVAPGPPALEVSLAGDGTTTDFRARVRVKSAAGATVSKIDLHRVRVPDAAVSVDMMGPPVATVTGSAGVYTVVATPAGDPSSRSDDGVAQAIGTITGLDTVPGSWKPVFYRAVAWGTDDPDRGQYGVRSQASVVRQIVVPPSAPPDLGTLGYMLPIAGSANVRIDVTTTAPVQPTPLGAHVLEAEVVSTDAAGVSTAFALDIGRGALDQLPTTQPGAGQSGLWRDASASGSTTLHLLVRRTDPASTLRVRMRITDPIGRITERTLDVPPGSAVPAPDILNPTLNTVPGGVIVSFTTSVPNQVPGVGDYSVEVAFRPSTGPRINRSETMAAIPVARRGEDIFAVATERIPLRRTRRTLGQSSIAVGLRANGVVTVAVVAPDGTRASINRTIRRGRVFP